MKTNELNNVKCNVQTNQKFCGVRDHGGGFLKRAPGRQHAAAPLLHGQKVSYIVDSISIPNRVGAPHPRRQNSFIKGILYLLLFFSFFSCNPHRDEPAPKPEPQVILIYGDTRTGHAAHREVVEAMMAMEPDIVFHTGDLVAHGWNPTEWVTFNEITSGLREIAAFYPALGNHDDNSMFYFQNFELPGNERWYSVVGRDGIHFIVLDSDSDTGLDSEQYKWFEAELRRVSGSVKFIVVIFHHPPFSTGPHDDEMGLSQTIVPLLERYNVRLVFNGHNHCYERCFYNGIYYIVAGGGGAPLYRQKRTNPYSQLYIKAYHFCELSVQGNRLKVTAYDVDLSVIDEFMVYN